MTKICRKTARLNFILQRVSIFRRFFQLVWEKVLLCSKSKLKYRRLATRNFPVSPEVAAGFRRTERSTEHCGDESDSDLVQLKISLLGDCQTGKTSFVLKYVGDEEEARCLEMKGISLVNKTISIEGATISFSLWDVGGDNSSLDQVPLACRNSMAILFMFDLTSRFTLNSVIGWYKEARKWNKTAIPVLIGTKFDDFIRLPPDLQWTIVTQARAYAKAMKATLFFSSSRHNINVNKIFKFIMAKYFNLPWTLHRNLTIGEPIIDF